MRALMALTIYVSLGAVAAIAQGDSPAAIASALRTRGEYPRAEKVLREALADRTADSERRGLLLNLLGDLMREEGQREEARRCFEEASRIPDSSWKRLAESHTGLADLDRESGLWDDSIAEWNSVAETARERHEATIEAVAWRGLGQTWLDRGNLARAEPLLRRALVVFENDPHSGNYAASTLSSIARLYLDEDKPALAEDALARALADEERAFGQRHPQVAVLLEMMGDAAAQRNHMELARGYFARALRIMVDKFGEDSIMSASVFANLGRAEQRAGDTAGAVLEYEKALVILRAGGRDARDLRLIVMRHYADALKSMHRGREAHAVLAEVKSFREK